MVSSVSVSSISGKSTQTHDHAFSVVADSSIPALLSNLERDNAIVQWGEGLEFSDIHEDTATSTASTVTKGDDLVFAINAPVQVSVMTRTPVDLHLRVSVEGVPNIHGISQFTNEIHIGGLPSL